MFLRFSPSRRSSSPAFILSTRFSLTRRLFISDAAGGVAPGTAGNFHQRIRENEDLFRRSSRSRFLVSISPTKSRVGTRGWTWRISQRKHTGSLPLSSDSFVRARRDYLRITRNTPAAAAVCCCRQTSCFNTGTFRLRVYIWRVLFRRASWETFCETRLCIYTATLIALKVTIAAWVTKAKKDAWRNSVKQIRIKKEILRSASDRNKKKRRLLILLTKNRYLFHYSRITSLDCTPQHFFAAR